MIQVWSDGSNTLNHSTRCAYIIQRNGETIEQTCEAGEAGWSDIAEYQAVVKGLKRLLTLGLQTEPIEWFNDSQFVMMQMAGKWKPKQKKAYWPFYQEAQALLQNFKQITFNWIPREENEEADALSKRL